MITILVPWPKISKKFMVNGLKKRNVFSAVDRPADRNPLDTTMVYQDKIDYVKSTVTRKCRLCLRGDWQREGIYFFKYKTYSAVLNCRVGPCTHLQMQILAHDFLRYSSGFYLWQVGCPSVCHPPPGFQCLPGTVFGLNLNYCLYGANQAPACFKGVSVEFMLPEGLAAVKDSQTVWIKRQGNSIPICACFVDDIHHFTNDVAML